MFNIKKMRIWLSLLVIAGLHRDLEVLAGNESLFCFLHHQSSNYSTNCQTPNRRIECKTNERITALQTVYLMRNQSGETCDECFSGVLLPSHALSINFDEEMRSLCLYERCCLFDRKILISPDLGFVDGTLWLAIGTYQCENAGFNSTKLNALCDNNKDNCTSVSTLNPRVDTYTEMDTEQTDTERGTSVALIAGITCGVIFLIVIVVIVTVFFRRRLKGVESSSKSRIAVGTIVTNKTYEKDDDVIKGTKLSNSDEYTDTVKEATSVISIHISNSSEQNENETSHHKDEDQFKTEINSESFNKTLDGKYDEKTVVNIFAPMVKPTNYAAAYSVFTSDDTYSHLGAQGNGHKHAQTEDEYSHIELFASSQDTYAYSKVSNPKNVDSFATSENQYSHIHIKEKQKKCTEMDCKSELHSGANASDYDHISFP